MPGKRRPAGAAPALVTLADLVSARRDELALAHDKGHAGHTLNEGADLLATVAEVEGRSVSDVAREAVADLVQARRKDKRFRRQLEENLARHQRLLDLLSEDPR